jgi:hypothetical protein
MKTSIKMNDSKDSLLIYDPETIRREIYTIREFQVMVDSD